MPTPKENEKKEDFIKRCVPMVMNEGTAKDNDQAVAICTSMYDKPKEKEMKIDTVEMKNVEILETGIWNGSHVKKTDIDEMINHFEKGILEPYLNLDHDDKFTNNVQRALSVVSLGFVSHLRREGKKLIANFKQVPRKVAELIKSGMLKQRSVEFFPKGFELNGKKFNNVLKAVSFFGADVPAVNSLSDDFEILLKSENFAVNFSNKTQSKKIYFINNGGKMETIEVSKKEYDDLVSFKATSKDELITFKEKVTDLEEKLEEAIKVNEKLQKLQKQYDDEKAVNLEKEATDFVEKIVNDGKLLPKFKDDKIQDYIEKASDREKLAMFKEDLESRDKVLELGAITDETTGMVIKDPASMSNDEINEAIEFKMKKTGKSWEEIAPEFGLDVS